MKQLDRFVRISSGSLRGDAGTSTRTHHTDASTIHQPALAACSGLLAIALCTFAPPEVAAGVIALGDVSPNQGTVPVWDLGTADLLIGNHSTGSLTITNGGEVSNGLGLIGKSPVGPGSVTVMGAGSKWTNSTGLYIGGTGFNEGDPGGSGRLIIADGGVVSSTGGYIGYRGTGTVMVRGAGSRWDSENLYVSVNQGTSSLTIVDGGLVVNRYGYIGSGKESAGKVTVSGRGARWDAQSLVLGNMFSNGALTIAGGGAVVNADSQIGAEGTGTVVVTGTDSRWDAGSLIVGRAGGNGAVTLANGGLLSATSILIAETDASAGTLNIGASADQAATAAGTLQRTAVTFGPGNGRIVFNHTDDAYVFHSAIHGAGTIDQIAGVTTLAGGGDFTGSVNVAGGVLLIDGQSFGQQDRSLPITAHLNIRADGVAGIAWDAAAAQMNVNNDGRFYAGNPLAGDASSPGIFHVGGDFSNSGVMYLNNASTVTGNTLRISGNYTGNGGVMHFNSVLGEDNSVTDRLNIEGDTSGTTYVVVNNAGGSGAATLSGIELIQVGGVSAGEFIQDGRIVAGAYEYRLSRGQGANAGNWYLDNSVLPVVLPSSPAPDPLPAPDPSLETELSREPELSATTDSNVELDPSFEPDSAVEAGSTGSQERRGTLVARPESGSYTANLAATNTLFIASSHERPEETRYIDALTGEQKVSSVWLRNAGSRYHFTDSSGQLQTRDSRYVVQLGGNVAQGSSNGRDRWTMGAMVGYGGSNSHTTSQVTGYSATGKVTGYGMGVYGTWFADAQERTGAYVDAWAHYGWFDNTVAGEGLACEKYRSRGSTVSVESGYAFPVSERIFVQPKMQVIRMGVRADDHREVNGTSISGSGNGNIQARVGVQVFMHHHDNQDKSNDRSIRPFVETNWIRNTRTLGTTMNGVTLHQAGATNVAELKLGAGGRIGRNLHVWGRVGLQKGNADYRDTSITGGVRYSF